MKSFKIGKCHPEFFGLDAKFSKILKKKVSDSSYIFDIDGTTLKYKDGTILCKDAKVLKDFKNMFKVRYGTRAQKSDYLDSVKSDKYKNGKVINVGVCYLKDKPYSGWDGTVNSIWTDRNAPGAVINVYYRFIMNPNKELNEVAIDDFSFEEMMDEVDYFLPLLIRRKALERTDKYDKLIDALIK